MNITVERMITALVVNKQELALGATLASARDPEGKLLKMLELHDAMIAHFQDETIYDPRDIIVTFE